ncbi:MAG: hypothetical protein ACFB5Z_17960 [Elainellaceae cyanobacterium]
MPLIVCPGVHDEASTQAFLQSLPSFPHRLVFPAHRYPAYSPNHVLEWLLPQRRWESGLCFVAFSAGTVGALGAARQLYRSGHQPVRGLIAIDGWGVPLIEPFPVHRLSHDEFTHRTSLLLGPQGGDHFYADPPVAHLELWRSPHRVSGQCVAPSAPQQQTTAAAFLSLLIRRYCRVDPIA